MTETCTEFDAAMDAERCAVCGKKRWRQIGPCLWECACDCAETLPVNEEESE